MKLDFVLGLKIEDFLRPSSRTPIRTRRLSRAFPSNRRRGSFSSSVSNSREAARILAKLYLTLQTSRLFLSPYSPMSLSSWSRRAFSKGLLGVVYTLLFFSGILPFTMVERVYLF